MADEQNKECIFCKIVNKEIDAEIIKENENFIAFPDANPKTEGHTLIVPKQHFHNLMDLPIDLSSEMIDMAKKVARERLDNDAEGFNLIMNNFEAAGQAVEHAHLHIIPRKKGDGLNSLV